MRVKAQSPAIGKTEKGERLAIGTRVKAQNLVIGKTVKEQRLAVGTPVKVVASLRQAWGY
jgi:hypothetical protein